MNGLQIEQTLNRCKEAKLLFKGVYASDRLPTFKNKPFSFIANTDGHTEPGTHWVAFYVDNGGVVEFFDTYGRSPYSTMFPDTFGKYVSRRHCLYNSRILEGIFGNTCGQLSIYYTCLRARGLSFKTIIESLSTNVCLNDEIVVTFLK